MTDDVHIGPFRVDVQGGTLRRGDVAVRLRPKAWALLCILCRERGKVVSGEVLSAALWPDSTVEPGGIYQLIGELRRALGDDKKAPRYLETVARRGFRLRSESTEPDRAHATRNPSTGRSAALAELQVRWRRACRGQRQTALVGGGAGAGKTALVETFLTQALDAAAEGSHALRMRCQQWHCQPEPYLPVFDALEDLAAQMDLTSMLRRCAPHWLLQMPWITVPQELATRRATVSAPAQMLNEGVQLLDAIAAHSALLVLVEDLHWADDATLALLAALARGQRGVALLLVGTCRLAEPGARSWQEVAAQLLVDAGDVVIIPEVAPL